MEQIPLDFPLDYQDPLTQAIVQLATWPEWRLKLAFLKLAILKMDDGRTYGQGHKLITAEQLIGDLNHLEKKVLEIPAGKHTIPAERRKLLRNLFADLWEEI